MSAIRSSGMSAIQRGSNVLKSMEKWLNCLLCHECPLLTGVLCKRVGSEDETSFEQTTFQTQCRFNA